MDIKPRAVASRNEPSTDKSDLKPELVHGIPVKQPGSESSATGPADSLANSRVSESTATKEIQGDDSQRNTPDEPQAAEHAGPPVNFHLIAVITIAVVVGLGLAAAAYLVFRQASTSDSSASSKILTQPLV